MKNFLFISKRLLSLFSFILLFFLGGKAQTFTSGDYSCTILNQDEIKITPIDKNSITSASIPSFIYYEGRDYKVSDLNFSNCLNLRTVDVASIYLTKLPYNAFQGCSSLTKVTLYEGLLEIGSGAFSDCSALRSLILPDGIEVIGSGIIKGTAISEISIPTSVEKFHPYALENDFLENIKVESSHPFLKSENGILYYEGKDWGKNIKCVVLYPPMKRDKEFTLDCSVIGTGLGNTKFLETLNLDGYKYFYFYEGGGTYQPYEDYLTGNFNYFTEKSLTLETTSLKTLNIKKEKIEITLYKSNLPNLESVNIDPTNDNYIVEDGLIYTMNRHYTNYPVTIDKTLKDLWLVPPQSAKNLTAYTGSIGNYKAFEWAENLQEIFDYSFSIGSSTDRYGYNIILNNINHPISYYIYPIYTYSIGYYLLDNTPSSTAHIYFLSDIKQCEYFDGEDYYYDRTIGCYYDVVYGPKGGVVSNLLSDKSKYGGDLNIIKVNAPEEIQNKIYIDEHRTHVFGVKDGNSVTIEFPQLPEGVNILVNGINKTSQMQNNKLRIADIQSHTTIELYTPSYLSVETSSDNASIYIDDHKQSRILNDNASHTVHIIPDEGYYIASVSVNGDDKTQELNNRYLIVPASEGSQTVSVDIQGNNEAMLTISTSEFQVAHYFNVGDMVLVNLTPLDNWDIHSVTFNGEDVTKDLNADYHYQTPALIGNDVLSVVYSKKETSGIEDDIESCLRVYTRGNSIVIQNKRDEEEVNVYNTSGMLICKTNENEIKNLEKGVYIVKISETAIYKLAI